MVKMEHIKVKWQDKRTADREARGVEGLNKA